MDMVTCCVQRLCRRNSKYVRMPLQHLSSVSVLSRSELLSFGMHYYDKMQHIQCLSEGLYNMFSIKQMYVLLAWGLAEGSGIPWCNHERHFGSEHWLFCQLGQEAPSALWIHCQCSHTQANISIQDEYWLSFVSLSSTVITFLFQPEKYTFCYLNKTCDFSSRGQLDQTDIQWFTLWQTSSVCVTIYASSALLYLEHNA